MGALTAILHWGEPDEGALWATCLENPAAAVELILEMNGEEAMRDDPRAVKTSLAVA